MNFSDVQTTFDNFCKALKFRLYLGKLGRPSHGSPFALGRGRSPRDEQRFRRFGGGRLGGLPVVGLRG